MSEFTILCVCIGNVCRSALADVFLRDALASYPVTVESAGTAALVGHPMDPLADEVAQEWGVGETSHSARQLTEPVATQADLLLVATRDIRRTVVEEYPSVVRRIFTFRQWGRLLAALEDEVLRAELAEFDAHPGGDGSDRARALVSAVGALRGVARPPESPDDDDVVDPFGASREVFDRMAEQLRPSLDQVVRLVSLAYPRGN